MSALGRGLMPLSLSLPRSRLPPAFPSPSRLQAAPSTWDSGLAIIPRLCDDWGPTPRAGQPPVTLVGPVGRVQRQPTWSHARAGTFRKCLEASLFEGGFSLFLHRGCFWAAGSPHLGCLCLFTLQGGGRSGGRGHGAPQKWALS